MTVSGDFLLPLWFWSGDRTEFQPEYLYLSLWGSSPNVYLFTSEETTSQTETRKQDSAGHSDHLGHSFF